VRQAFAGSSLLFLGYRPADLNFRVLFRTLIAYMGRSTVRNHISVQLSPSADNLDAERMQKVQTYLNRYFSRLEVQVYWGTCRAFVAELAERGRSFR
jgi:hypothetical protein